MTTVKILTDARALLTDRGHWTQHQLARNEHGTATLPRSEQATCWCMVGAIEKVAPNINSAVDAKIALKKATVVPVPRFNDQMTHQGVLDAFDRAISLASDSLGSSCC